MKYYSLILFHFAVVILYQTQGSQVASHQLPTISEEPEYFENSVFSAVRENDIKKLDDALAVLGKYCNSESILTDKKALSPHDITLTNNLGLSPLLYAVFRARPESCSYLLTKKVPSNVKQKGSNNNIWDIVRNETTTVLRWKNSNPTSPLTPIQQKRLHKVAHTLLEHNVAYDEYENEWDNLGRCQCPRKKRSSPDWLDELMEANQENEYGSVPLVRALLEKETPEQLLTIQSLLEKGANVNGGGTCSSPPLHWANNECIFKLLLENGADINKPDVLGRNCLHYACLEKNLDKLNFLLDHKADPNQCDTEGTPPLLMEPYEKKKIQEKNYPTVLKLLLDHGANANITNKEGYTLLEKIMMKEDLEDNDLPRIQLLLAHKANTHSEKLHRSKTILHKALENLPADLIEPFIKENSTHINTQDSNGFTPLYYAIGKKYFCLIPLLLKFGADCSIEDIYGMAPLHRACTMIEALETVALLIEQPQAITILNNRSPLILLAEYTKPQEIKNDSKKLKRASEESIKMAQAVYPKGIPDFSPSDYPLPDPLAKAILLAESYDNALLAEWMKKSQKF